MPDDSSVAFSVKQRMFTTEIAILILDCNAENPRMQAKFYSYKNCRDRNQTSTCQKVTTYVTGNITFSPLSRTLQIFLDKCALL